MEAVCGRLQYVGFQLAPSTVPQVLYDQGNAIVTLQSLMHLKDHTDDFTDFLRIIRHVARQHGVDLTVPYRNQDLTLMKIVEEEVLEKLPFLRKYFADGWPVTFYLKRSLKSHGSALSAVAKRNYDEAPYKYPGPYPLPTKRTVVTRADTAHEADSIYAGSISRRNDAPFSTCPDLTAGGSMHIYRRTPSMSPPSAAQSASISSMTPDAGSSLTPHTSSVNPDASVFDFLLDYHLPREDAEHIHRLFAAMGVSNIPYLRVLAHMRTRDVWLRELREKGSLSEVQIRVVREMLEQVASGRCAA